MSAPAVLVAEDEVIVAVDMAACLRRAGYRIVGQVISGEEAVSLAAETCPELVLMDIKLAGDMNGIEAARQIQSVSDTAVVYITAHTEPEVFKSAKLTEPCAYLTKPVSPGELVRTVDMALYKHAMARRLRQSEEQYRTLVETINEGVLSVDTEARITYANDWFTETLGFSRDEVIGRSVFDFFSPTHMTMVADEFKRRKNGIRGHYEVEVRSKRGDLIDVSVSASPLIDTAGRFQGAMGIFTDITARKRAEQKLKRSTALLEALNRAQEEFLVNRDPSRLFDGLLTAILAFTDSESGFMSEVSQAPDALTHVRTRALAGTGPTDDLWTSSARNGSNGLSFPTMNTLFGAVFTSGEPVLTNNPSRDLRAGGLPAGRVPLDSFLGLPLYKGDTMLGVIGLANRPGGYDDELLESLQPYLGACASITEAYRNEHRKRHAEEQLRKSEAAYKLIADSASDIIVRATPDGILLYVSPAAQRILGYDPAEELLGHSAYEFMHPEDAAAVKQLHVRLLERPRGTTVAFRARRKDGKYAWIEASALVISDPETREPFHMIAVCRDITERKRQEEEIIRLEREKAAILDSLSEILVYVDTDFRVRSANRVACELIGVESQSLIGRYCYDVWYNRSTRCEQCPVTMAFESGQPAEVQTKLRDGRSLIHRGFPVFDGSGHIIGGVVSAQDITHRERAENLQRQAERTRAVVDLAAGVAHNFNNLLQVILGSANLGQMALESGDFSEVRTSLDQIVESSRFGAETVRRLNRFAKPRAEGDRSKVERFDLSDIARQAIALTSTWWNTNPKNEGFKIILTVDLTDGCTVEGKKDELCEVLINLICNASEAMREGGDLRITTLHDKEKAVVTVRDSGTGMSAVDLGRVFTPFFTTKCDAGAGLALATSRSVVEWHGGRILVDSLQGRGTIFTVILPLAEGTSEAVPAVSDQPLPDGISTLVIDDMESVVGMLRKGLTTLGHRVLTAYSGEDGLELFRQNPVDLVICDLGMPGIDGWTVGKAIREHCEQGILPKPPLILLTGWDVEGVDDEQRMEAGVDRIVEKPVDVADLVDVIRELFDDRAAGVTCGGPHA